MLWLPVSFPWQSWTGFWHPLPTVPAAPEESQPFLRRGRELPTLQCARRLLHCLGLVSTLCRVISSLTDSKFSVLPRAALPAQESRTATSQEPQELLSPVQLHVPGFTLPSSGTPWEIPPHFHRRFVQLFGATHRECLDVHLGCSTWLTLCHGEHLPAR